MKRISSVVTVATTQNLTTVSNVKADLNISGSSEDAYLVRRVNEASKLAATYCARTFMSETVDDTFYMTYGDSPEALVLSRRPVSSITSVTVDGEALTSSDYHVETATGLLYRKNSDGDLTTWDGEKTVVRFVGGYSSVPEDLEGAVIGLIKAMRSARERDPTVRSERVPDVMEVTYWVRGPGESNLPPEVAGTLDLYREIHV